MRIRKAADRGVTKNEWLFARHTFSFGSYYDPENIRFRTLRVMNHDIVQPNSGFDFHPHDNMEIITYIIRGKIQHQDSMGNSLELEAGDFQVMSAGTGIVHSERNPSKTDELELYQIWILANEKNVKPSYQDLKLGSSNLKKTGLRLIVSQDGREGSLKIHQEAEIFHLMLNKNDTQEFEMKIDSSLWVQVVSGSVKTGRTLLAAGDGLGIEENAHLEFKAQENQTSLLLFSLL